MILSGEKKEEYRNHNLYWIKRLVNDEGPIPYETITFSNGYRKDRRQMVVEYLDLRIFFGKEKWGADPNETYFVLKLGKILKK